MRILISGSTGFVGSNLIEYLNSSLGKGAVVPLDLRGNWTEDFNKRITAVIHLAGKAHDLKKTADVQEYYTVNFDLTKALYDVFLQSDAKQFFFISSVKAAADTIEGILDEKAVPNPQTHYGKSKLMAEEYLQSKPLPFGKSVYILRPCMIHGPGNKGNLNLLYQVVKKGIPYPLASFSNKRSYLSVENLCFTIREFLIHSAVPSGIYNVADDESFSTNEVVTILSASLNKKPKLWYLSKSVISLLAKIGDQLHLPLTTERLEKLTESYVVSNAKLTAVLHDPLPVSATDGLKRTARSFQNT